MRSPRFKVGEVVTLQSKYYSHTNGEYAILGVIDQITYEKLYPSFIGGQGYYYDLGIKWTGNKCGRMCKHCSEQSLKKKHKPSDQSFDQIMSSLKQPQKA